MVMDWNQYHKEIGARVGDLAKLSPDTVKRYQTLSAANSKTSKLGEKTRQLLVSKCRSNPPFFAIEADLLVTPSDSPRRRQE